jgi:hypothetical protein
MSLTSALEDRKGPVARFFVERFPDIRDIQKAWRVGMEGATTIRPLSQTQPPWSTIGHAIDYRLRYYFAETPAEDLVATLGASLLAGVRRVTRGSAKFQLKFAEYDLATGPSPSQARWSRLSGEFFSRLDATVREIRPARRRLDSESELELCRYCYVLALFEEIYRAGPGISSPLNRLSPRARVAGLLQLGEPWVEDLSHQSWAFFDGHRERLQEPAVLNPGFDGSLDILGADADLILSTCLVDFKTVTDPMTLRRVWLEQLIGYVLLDYGDRYGLTEVGIYMTRQGLLIRWDLDRLLTQISSSAFGLSQLRRAFRSLLRSLNPHPMRKLMDDFLAAH